MPVVPVASHSYPPFPIIGQLSRQSPIGEHTCFGGGVSSTGGESETIVLVTRDTRGGFPFVSEPMNTCPPPSLRPHSSVFSFSFLLSSHHTPKLVCVPFPGGHDVVRGASVGALAESDVLRSVSTRLTANG